MKYLILMCTFQLYFLLVNAKSGRAILKEKLLQTVGKYVDSEVEDEAFLEATDLIKLYGYPVENQTIQTKDNYFLISQRILNGKAESLNNGSRIPVVLLHSLDCESAQWFDNGPTSLAFVLADEGYDVWACNFRGTKYSYHSEFTPDMEQYWDFSADDFIFQDLPAIIDHVLNVTGYSKLFIIGHSLGATVPFLTLAALPEYNDKVVGFLAMAPVIEARYITSVPIFFLSRAEIIQFYIRNSKSKAWGTLDPLIQKLGFTVCSRMPSICETVTYLTFGYNPYLNNNRSRIGMFIYHCANGVSTRCMQQMLQTFTEKRMRQFDYGLEKNLDKYHNTTPPEYNISQVVTPTVIFLAPNDCVANVLDVTLLARRIPNLIGKELFPEPTASHNDFIWASSAKELVYYKVLTYLKQLWK